MGMVERCYNSPLSLQRAGQSSVFLKPLRRAGSDSNAVPSMRSVSLLEDTVAKGTVKGTSIAPHQQNRLQVR